ncbi:Nitroreductase [Lojkania enalia]|uniref:Nitroreductase n=1 Tax=Lojkania enalia TaxID=147567 RepID=A0A9P4KIB0_9PLEO|nr:Nitroreductase [Didymosphaeria enalia]
MASTVPFLEAVASRRSIYTLSKESTIPNHRILEIVKHALKYAPSPFNVRSARCIVLFGDDHSKLWQNAYQVTEQATPQAIEILGLKIKGLEAAYGTAMWFDDEEAYNDLTPRFAALSKQYPEWEEHSSGMHQFIVWTALAAEGMGANLQHYQSSISPFVHQMYDVPVSWKLKAQLVFGKPTAPAGVEKPKMHLDDALKAYGM